LTLNPAPMWHDDGWKKHIFEVLYYPSYDSHVQKTQLSKLSKFLIWR
jgi:hypothetical protein